MDIIIRKETQADVEVISRITEAAFETHPISQHTEQFIVLALRAAKVLTLSLVAEVEGKVVGHIAFSPVTISDGSTGWFGLGPISVLPERQRRGIGKALMQEGLSLLEGMGAKGCVLVGDPNYYERFGFRNRPELVYEGIPQEYFLALPFDSPAQGTVTFHEAFAATA